MPFDYGMYITSGIAKSDSVVILPFYKKSRPQPAAYARVPGTATIFSG